MELLLEELYLQTTVVSSMLLGKPTALTLCICYLYNVFIDLLYFFMILHNRFIMDHDKHKAQELRQVIQLQHHFKLNLFQSNQKPFWSYMIFLASI